jgi:hypothetical protein
MKITATAVLMNVTGNNTYQVGYTYDFNNRLLNQSKTEGDNQEINRLLFMIIPVTRFLKTQVLSTSTKMKV